MQEDKSRVCSSQQEMSDKVKRFWLLPALTIALIAGAVAYETHASHGYELREFTSFEELKSWLAEDDTDAWTIPDTGQVVATVCVRKSSELQRRALAQGYIMNVEIEERIILENDLNYWRSHPQMSPSHAVNTTPIGGILYRIEPQTDVVTVKACLLPSGTVGR
ncbi:MAG: hypothetical protein V1894_05105 [Chloroflexota bacterium]